MNFSISTFIPILKARQLECELMVLSIGKYRIHSNTHSGAKTLNILKIRGTDLLFDMIIDHFGYSVL